MIRINLLPYRVQRRQNLILKHLGVLLAVIFITGITVVTVDLYKTSELTALEDTFSELVLQNNVLKKKIGKIRDLDKLRADVERKLELVDTLQQGRFHSLISLNELASVIPENVWVTAISDNGGVLAVNGLGESNKAVANFMRALDQSPFFSHISLKTIARTKAGNVPVRSFALTMSREEKKAEVNTKKGEGA
jgi:type IV pilus assembly protein PilN